MHSNRWLNLFCRKSCDTSLRLVLVRNMRTTSNIEIAQDARPQILETHVQTYVGIYIYMYTHVLSSIHIYIYIYMHTYIHVGVCACKMANSHILQAKHPRSREGVERQGQLHKLLQRLPKWLQRPASDRRFRVEGLGFRV